MIDLAVPAAIGFTASPNLKGLILGATSPSRDDLFDVDRRTQATVLIGFAAFHFAFSASPLRDYVPWATLAVYCLYTNQITKTDSWIIVPFARTLLAKDTTLEQLCMMLFFANGITSPSFFTRLPLQ